MSDPVAVDVWNKDTSSLGEDGYTDHVYVGDMNGVLYGIKLNFDPTTSTKSGETGIYVDLWKTKPIPLNSSGTQDYGLQLFRSRLQPLTTQPSIAMEKPSSNGDQQLRIIIAGGKHEDVEGEKTDATDVAKMSLYNLRDKVRLPTLANFTANGNQKLTTGTITYTDPDLAFAVRPIARSRRSQAGTRTRA